MSGNERNCCFLNTLGNEDSGNRFATASAVSGLDFDDDGQAACRVDWDHDGDLDLILSNRNAPRIRFMRNNTPEENGFLQFQLVGNGNDTNRNAIGARVVVTLESDSSKDPVRLVKGLYGGDGYLSQSTRWVHFGLGDTSSFRIAKVEVRWPNKTTDVETFDNIQPNQRYRIVQGQGQATVVNDQREALDLQPSVLKLPPTDLTMRIPLVNQFVAPPMRYTDFQGKVKILEHDDSGVVLINLWSTTCVPCVKELKEFTDRHEELKAAGIRVLALSVDELQEMPDATAKSKEMAQRLKFPFAAGMASPTLISDLERLHNSFIRLKRALPMPTSFLIDRNGRLNTIYKGALSVDTLLADAKPLSQELDLVQRYQRAAAFPGTVLDNPMVNERMERIATSALIFQGKEYVASRQLESAEKAFLDALKQVPDSAVINNELALVYDAQNRDDLAIKHYQKALEINPDNAALNINIAQALIRTRKYEEAAKNLDQAIEIDPENADAHFNRGVVYSAQRDVTKERACYEKAISFKPDHAQALFRLGRIFESQSDLGSAKSNYQLALEAAPGQAPVLTGLARVLAATGDRNRAEKLLQEATRREPRYAEARFELGRLAAANGDTVAARQHFMATLQLNKRHQGAMRALQELPQ